MARLFPKTQVLRPKMDYLVRPHLILFLISSSSYAHLHYIYCVWATDTLIVITHCWESQGKIEIVVQHCNKFN